MKKIIISSIILILIILSGCTNINANVTKTNQEPIKIGFIGPTTGNLANLGNSVKNTLQLVIDISN